MIERAVEWVGPAGKVHHEGEEVRSTAKGVESGLDAEFGELAKAQADRLAAGRIPSLTNHPDLESPRQAVTHEAHTVGPCNACPRKFTVFCDY